MKKVLLVIAFQGYQPIEYTEPKNILLASGHEVVTASDELGIATTNNNEYNTKVDLKIEDINVDNFVGLFFIGGPGALEHLDNKKTYQLLQKWQTTGKPYGAICISPRILARARVLKNKKATGWNNDGELEKIFTQSEVRYIPESVVIDGNIITADGPMSATKFGEEILKLL